MYKPTNPALVFILPWSLTQLDEHPIYSSILGGYMRPDLTVRWVLYRWDDFNHGCQIPLAEFAHDLLEIIFSDSDQGEEEQLQAEAFLHDNIAMLGDHLGWIYHHLQPLLRDAPMGVTGHELDDYTVEPFDAYSTVVTLEFV